MADPPVRRRVVAAIERLSMNSEGPATTALVGHEGRRLRVGDWRVLYRVDVVARTLTILRALPRGRAYRS
jgi:mRNA-degrading endonuclease RelE of RelBE toxin-antitoxin system